MKFAMITFAAGAATANAWGSTSYENGRASTSLTNDHSAYSWKRVANLGECKGDCDADRDCRGDLKCFQRSSRQAVPNCAGSGSYSYDYCYDPLRIDSHMIIGHGPTPSSQNLGACRGDCDRDSDCNAGLKCFFNEDVPIPGCAETRGRSRAYDYCYNPNSQPLVRAPANRAFEVSDAIIASGKVMYGSSEGGILVMNYDCITDGPGRYANYEDAIVHTRRAGILQSVEFDTETTYDYLQIGSSRYSGRNGPNNLALPANAAIKWHSDRSVQDHGFTICLRPVVTGNPTNNPTDSPTLSPTNQPTNRPTLNPTASPTLSPTGTCTVSFSSFIVLPAIANLCLLFLSSFFFL